MKTKVTEEMVKDLLPSPPPSFRYTVERVTPQVLKVWLEHPDKYLSKANVRTIYAYIKRDKVHAPRNKEKMRVEALCDITELPTCDPYSTINDTHNVTSLQHLS